MPHQSPGASLETTSVPWQFCSPASDVRSEEADCPTATRVAIPGASLCQFCQSQVSSGKSIAQGVGQMLSKLKINQMNLFRPKTGP